jgi:hypothetical protein
VAEYLKIMDGDPRLGMIQAPWMLVDGRPGGGDIGPFYRVPYAIRQEKGDFQSMLDFILNHHAFPEFMIIRRDVLAKSISSPTPFIFWAFLYTARALDKADVLFMPDPFARVTAVSEDPRLQQGNKECMFQWDSYRGGLEYLTSLAQRGRTVAAEQRLQLTQRITQFMLMRQGVALKLHVNAKNWVEAYIMYHRMAAYQPAPVNAETFDHIRKLAGISTAATEATKFTTDPVFIDPVIQDSTLSLLPQSVLERLTRDAPVADGSNRPRAFLRITPEFPPNPQPRDGIFDLMTYVEQFV